MTRPSQPVWYSLIVLVAAMLLTAGTAIWYADRTAQESERQWCSVVTTLDTAYRESPPTSPLGRQLAAAFADLRREFGCPPR